MNGPVKMMLAATCLLASPLLAAGDDALVKALKEREGKLATVLLTSGTELTGKVSSVSDDSVKLSELTGKEFFDAVIDLDDVQAVVVRAR
ncbi:MAG: hypothetical protein ACT4PG_02990 [Panacagrimonas sp.]